MKTRILICLFLIFSGTYGLCATNEPEDLSHPKTLDGVYVQAVETYINSKHHELTLGMGLYPFNAYYNGFSGNLGYTYYFDSTLGWEVVSGSMVFSVQKGLTSELADKYSVNPEKIERLQYTASTNLLYVLSYGKSVLFRKVLEYSRTGLIGGVGVVNTSTQSRIAATLGLHFDGYINDTFSWRFEFRDYITVKDFSHYGAFSLGTCVYF